jgi:predicted AlkP superfamily pyrophosphatase or phosphodiesterase
MKRFTAFVFALVLVTNLSAQDKKEKAEVPAKPKLIVGLMVDQMRYDFLYRYADKYGKDGIKRLLTEGYSCENTHINYVPSYTAPGHTSVYTGGVPAVHGITGNGWYDREEGKYVYCTDDTLEHTIGNGMAETGMMSPRRMLTTTITDELHLANNFSSKVIGIAIKDRSSILPAGHTGDAAYFLDDSTGSWVSSSYYKSLNGQLPQWVNNFNALKLNETLIKDNWATLLPIIQYTESHEDDKGFEDTFNFETKPVFTHEVSKMLQMDAAVVKRTPFGNTFTLEFAKAAIKNENLGKGNVTDFLAVSLSSTDYVGHQFGPNSVEIEDTYLRLDKDLAAFFKYLDETIGKGNYLLFITADHGAAHSTGYMKEKKIPAGNFSARAVIRELKPQLTATFGDSLIIGYANQQITLDHKAIAAKNIDAAKVKAMITTAFMKVKGVENIVDYDNISAANLEETYETCVHNSHLPKRSGDLYVALEPGWMEGYSKGTTHGSFYGYDTHIPLVWMGWKVKQEKDYGQIYITDIAATLAAMLSIQEPSGCVGKPIKGLLKD